MYRPKTKDITAKFIDLLRTDCAQRSTKEKVRKPCKNLKDAFITISIPGSSDSYNLFLCLAVGSEQLYPSQSTRCVSWELISAL